MAKKPPPKSGKGKGSEPPPKKGWFKPKGAPKGKVRGGSGTAREHTPQTKASAHKHNGNGVSSQSDTHVYIYCTCGELYSSYNKKDL